MYMVEEILQVPLGKHPQAREYLRTVQEGMAKHPGHIRSQVCTYGGNIRPHLFLQYWENAAGYESWSKSPAAAAIAGVRPGGLYTVQPGGKYWELLLETLGDSEGGSVNQGIMQVLDESKWGEFMEQRVQHDKNALENGGLVYVQAFKYVGEPLDKFFTPLTIAIIVRRKSREDYERSVIRGQAVEGKMVPAYKVLSPQLPHIAGIYDVYSEVAAGK